MIIGPLCSRSKWNFTHQSAGVVSNEDSKDPGPLFFTKEIYFGLKKLTRVDYDKVFRTRKFGQPIQRPIYKFMTDEQLKQEMVKADAKAQKLLQMPPVVKIRKDEPKVFSEDPAIAGHETTKIVFTDITYGVSDRNRLVVVREPNGVLREATAAEKHRMNQVYFPVSHKEMDTPKMFEPEHLENVLQRKEYEFILDRACTQFEPDSEEYHNIVKQVYERVNAESHFESLRSTRHFGPMVFHLLWEKKPDNLLIELLNSDYLDEAVLTIELYYKIHPTDNVIINQWLTKGGLELIESFAHIESHESSKLLKSIGKMKDRLMRAKEQEK